MKRVLVTFAALALITTSCGSDDSGPVATSGPGSTSATTAPTTPVSPSSTAGAGVLTPEVACWDEVDTYTFTYSYTGSEPVAIPIGDTNTVTGGDPDDNPLPPTIFAPGEHVPAFWKMTGDDPITWSLTGPDGETRTVTADENTPACEDPGLTFVDLVATGDGAALSTDGTTATLDVTIAGLPEMSTCPSALEPRPMTLFTEGGDPVDGNPTTLTATVEPNDRTGHQVADFRTVIWALDHCAWQEQETVTWSEPVTGGASFCYIVVDGALTLDGVSPDDCPGLGSTGGGRIRPTDSTTTAPT